MVGPLPTTLTSISTGTWRKGCPHAQILVQKEPLCPVVVDEMKNAAAVKYGALPERLYVLQAGKVVYKGQLGPWGYDPQEVRSFLEKMK
ncbi:Type I iodothyronine deiodinase [Nibea albiflora]|uniref:Type I iodothyronine deiodinase n=1 Tax=Nibea albiflora TaxID=240163 RepID=A0ACB7EP86_NIBAL|nr:Type I iodothyronine deiodinase [Nibea albiflora]